MGVVRNHGRSSIFVFVATTVYATLVFFTAAHHEPWADEAQAWLLARDSSLASLWLRLLHYEGTPGLWHTLLFCLAKVNLPYSALSYVSAGLGTAAAYLVFRFAPFPLPLRLLVPFTYFLAYQYGVVARSYSLIPPLLFGVAAVYERRERYPWLYAGLLSGLALSSMHGLALAVLIAIATFRHRAVALFAGAAGIAVWSAWPAADVTFVRHMNYSAAHAGQVATRVLEQAFTGEWITGLAVVAASVWFLWRRGASWLFLTAAMALIGLAAVVYGQVWHFGLVFLAWLFTLWLAGLQSGFAGRSGWLAGGALGVAMMVHCVWEAQSVAADWGRAYSGGKAAAAYLLQEHIPQAGLYGVGYACVAVQPYFAKNVFRNWEHAYWDWSSRNHMIADYAKLGESKPEWVLVGYKNTQENYLWNAEVGSHGYRRVKHFSGGLIWKGEVFEPESFDLYRRQ